MTEFHRTNPQELKCWSTFFVNYFLRYYLMMQHQPIVKRVNGTHEWAHTAACTNTGSKMKGSHSRAVDRCPFVLRHSLSQVSSFMQLGMLWMVRFTQGLLVYLTSTWAMMWLTQSQWSNRERNGQINHKSTASNAMTRTKWLETKICACFRRYIGSVSQLVLVIPLYCLWYALNLKRFIMNSIPKNNIQAQQS